MPEYSLRGVRSLSYLHLISAKMTHSDCLSCAQRCLMLSRILAAVDFQSLFGKLGELLELCVRMFDDIVRPLINKIGIEYLCVIAWVTMPLLALSYYTNARFSINKYLLFAQVRI